MFYLGWIALTAVGIWIGIAVFIWALKSGQFSDQQRARYLPLHEEFPMAPVGNPSRPTAEVYALLIVVALGLSAVLAAVVLTVLHGTG